MSQVGDVVAPVPDLLHHPSKNFPLAFIYKCMKCLGRIEVSSPKLQFSKSLLSNFLTREASRSTGPRVFDVKDAETPGVHPEAQWPWKVRTGGIRSYT